MLNKKCWFCFFLHIKSLKVVLPGQKQWLCNVSNIPVSFCLPVPPPTGHGSPPPPTSPQLDCSASSLVSVSQAGRRKGQGREGNAGIRKAALSPKSPRQLLLRSHWPESNHIAIDNCRRGYSNCPEKLNFGPEAVPVWG